MPKKPISLRQPNPEKIKDMVESILPAKRKGSRVAFLFKRMERRKVRHLVNMNLRTVDREGYTERPLFLKPCQTYNVLRRRDCDKVNPFLHWAERKTVGMSKKEALSNIRKILPPNLIGDHAYSHWKIKAGYYRHPHQNDDGDFFALFPLSTCKIICHPELAEGSTDSLLYSE